MGRWSSIHLKFKAIRCNQQQQKQEGGGAYGGALNQTYQMCHGIKLFDGINKFGNVSFVHRSR